MPGSGTDDARVIVPSNVVGLAQPKRLMNNSWPGMTPGPPEKLATRSPSPSATTEHASVKNGRALQVKGPACDGLMSRLIAAQVADPELLIKQSPAAPLGLVKLQLLPVVKNEKVVPGIKVVPGPPEPSSMIMVGSVPLALAGLATARTNTATARKLRIWLNRRIFLPPRRDLLRKSLHVSPQR